MACDQMPDLSIEDFGREVISQWIENRVPVRGSFESDLRCNLRYLNCYLDGK